MSAKEDAAYKAWLAEVQDKLPEDVKDAFAAVTAHEVGKEVFRGSLRRADYDRRVGEVEQKRQELQQWFETEAPKNRQLVAAAQEYKTKLDAYETTLKELGLDDSPTPGTKATSVAKKEDFAEFEQKMNNKLVMIDRALPKLLGDLSTVIHKAVKEDYDIDPREVLDYAAKNSLNPIQAFETLTADEREKRQEKAQKDQEEKWKEMGRKEALSKLPSPDRIRPAGPTVVDHLMDSKATASDQRTRVNEAVKDFLEGNFTGGSSLL